MKLITLSEEFLKYMVQKYSLDDNKELFDLDTFKTLHPELSDNFISKALYLLEKDGLVTVQEGDDVAYMNI